MALETGELIGIAVTTVTAMGGVVVAAMKWLGGIFTKIQADNATLSATIQADSTKARADFSTALDRVEANHSTMHKETLSTLRQIEEQCSERAERAHQTIMKLIDDQDKK